MKRCSISLKKMICEVLAWLNGPMGVRVILLLLWLLSVIFVCDYTARKTIETIDLTELRLLGAAQVSCSVAADMEQQSRDQYRKLMKMADNCIVWKDAGPSF